MNDRLEIPSQARAILQEVGGFGDALGKAVYVVGGFVRDLFLRRENLDLDIVLEADAISFAERLCQQWRGHLHTHAHFGTATITRPDSLKVDFVTARSETYAHPGALPSVKRGSIADDLWRRDFSINALAMQINPEVFGRVVDFTGGQDDIGRGIIRALHSQSFIDDPTRIFRALRYAARYGFEIAQADVERIQHAVSQRILDWVSGQRLRNEIDRILDEPTAAIIIQRLETFGLFRAIHPDWVLPNQPEQRWKAAQQAIRLAQSYDPDERLDMTAIRWMALFDSLKATEAVAGRLVLENALRDKLTAAAHLLTTLNQLQADIRPSEVYQMLKPYSLEALWFVCANTSYPEWQRAKALHYLTHSRQVEPIITGTDLIQSGLQPGPSFSHLLWRALAAQLDGEVSTKTEAYRLLGLKT